MGRFPGKPVWPGQFPRETAPARGELDGSLEGHFPGKPIDPDGHRTWFGRCLTRPGTIPTPTARRWAISPGNGPRNRPAALSYAALRVRLGGTDTAARSPDCPAGDRPTGRCRRAPSIPTAAPIRSTAGIRMAATAMAGIQRTSTIGDIMADLLGLSGQTTSGPQEINRRGVPRLTVGPAGSHRVPTPAQAAQSHRTPQLELKPHYRTFAARPGKRVAAILLHILIRPRRRGAHPGRMPLDELP